VVEWFQYFAVTNALLLAKSQPRNIYTHTHTHTQSQSFALLLHKWRDLQTVASEPEHPIHNRNAEGNCQHRPQRHEDVWRNCSTDPRLEVSGQLHALAALTPGKEVPGTHWIEGWVGARAGLYDMER
jgi:hypothetical protein